MALLKILSFLCFLQLSIQQIDIDSLPDLSSLLGDGIGDSTKPDQLKKIACSSGAEKDILFVVESPTEDRLVNFQLLRRFYADIVELEMNPCNRVGFLLSDQEIREIKKFSGPGHKTRITTAIDNLKNMKPKRNLLNIISNIVKGQYFDGSRDSAEKVIVMVMTSKKDAEVPVADKIKSILEAMDEENGVPVFRYTVLAVGIEAGAYEDLHRITLNVNRVIVANSFIQLNKGEVGTVYESIKRMVANPPGYGGGFQFSANLLGELNTLSDQDAPVSDVDAVIDEDEKCSNAVDIAFLVDSSHTVRDDWSKELLFVQRIANRFNISESGAHAGVVIFSDLNNFTRVEIRMRDHLNTKDFNDAVKNLPFIGYRTRMDLAFKVTHEQLLTKAGGVRGQLIPKLVVLITDGKQNPTRSKNITFDPVEASRPLYESPNTAIIAIGVSDDVDVQQLYDITRDKSLVSVVDTIDNLVSDEFVRNFTKKLCNTPGSLKTTVVATTPPCTTSVAPSSCQGVGKCSKCCGSHDVYINIFQSSGNYLVQGMKLSQTPGGTLNGVNLPHTGTDVNLSSTENIVNTIKDLLPQHVDLAERLRSILQQNKKEVPTSSMRSTSVIGVPGLATNGRRRRSLDDIPIEYSIFDLTKVAGCSMFVKSLFTQGLLLEVVDQRITLFCPSDQAYQKYLRNPDARVNDRDVMMYHVGKKSKSNNNNNNVTNIFTTRLHGAVLRTTPNKISNNRVISMKVNNEANILYTVRNEKFELSVIDRVLIPETSSLSRILKLLDNKRTSVFRSLLRKAGLQNVIKIERVDRICFRSGLCASLGEDLQERITEMSPLTVLAPTNAHILRGMKKSALERLQQDRQALITWLKQYIFIGQLAEYDGGSSHHEELLVSSDQSHAVATRVKGLGPAGGFKLNVLDRVFDVEKGPMKFREGTAYLVEEE